MHGQTVVIHNQDKTRALAGLYIREADKLIITCEALDGGAEIELEFDEKRIIKSLPGAFEVPFTRLANLYTSYSNPYGKDEMNEIQGFWEKHAGQFLEHQNIKQE